MPSLTWAPMRRPSRLYSSANTSGYPTIRSQASQRDRAMSTDRANRER